ncbi:TonB-dependent receptor [Pseudidiomarina donghaiensis]|uniref:TonB-dependent receptor n=1 Tax=Pseudidiomarina donghaiensis TaxID=519452 RepID=UPI0008EC2A21|nr:TonB-dependent receptor [Pseudidiomarina donghaiensis]SFV23669.1 TonB-dependent Receptor Plug Domain [Pseudidiomarina donghaiensis]
MKKINLPFGVSLCAIAVATALPQVALAQDNSEANEVEAQERITVTGSRINRTDMETASPVEIISRDDIEASGFSNLQQLLERSPAAGVGTFSTRGNSQDSTANGGAAVSLRGFGADATLVLVNGRRVNVSAFAEGVANSFVDINTIPVAAIERIDILKDGASAIYGSDAVAGVVNVILRKDYEGMELSLSHGATTGPSYDETSVSTVWGTGSATSNTTVIFDYYKNTSIMGSEMGRFGTANQAPYGGNDFRSSRGYPGNFILNGQVVIDPDCPPEQTFGQTCVYDYGPATMTWPEAERVGAMVLSNFQITSDMDAYIEFAAQHNSSKAGGAATPLDGDAGLYVPANHPNNPWGERVEINRYRTVDAGNRVWDIESDTLRFVAGLRGYLDTWAWDVSATKARSRGLQTGSKDQGWVRTDFLQEEINAGRYNPFGGVTNDPAVIDAITTSLVRRGESHLTAVDASISGELFKLGNNMVSMAAGFEYREEDVVDTPDDQFQRGLIFGTESVSAQAERDQWAAYAEFLVPLADTLELSLALRHDDYSDFGSSTNPQAKIQWFVSDDITVRASAGTGFRAPSLAQIGLGPSQVSQFFTDTYRCPTPDPNNPACAATDYTIVFGGNPNLEAEESESWNIGGVWQVNDSWDVSLDYWSIVQDNKIDRNNYELVYAAECNDQNSTICVRLPPLPGETLGSLSTLYNSYINISSQEATGLDVSTNYLLPISDFGDLKFGLGWTYMTKFEKNGIDYAGEYNYPQHRWIGSVDWSRDAWGATAIITYIGEFEDYQSPQDVESSKARTIDAHMVLDLQMRYDISQSTRFSVGVNNILDEEPPFAIGDGDGDLYGYASSVHNPRGAFAYAKLNFKF